MSKLYNVQAVLVLMRTTSSLTKTEQTMRISRKFTQEGVSPYADIDFRKSSCVIKNPDGSVVFEMKDIDVPSSWSQVASGCPGCSERAGASAAYTPSTAPREF